MTREDSLRGWALSTFKLLRFMNKLLSFLKPESIAAMITANPVKSDTSLCWKVRERGENKLDYLHLGDPIYYYHFI